MSDPNISVAFNIAAQKRNDMILAIFKNLNC